MPNAEVRKKWQHVAAGGFSDEALADIKWYSMVPGLPRLTPELCSEDGTPNIVAWLARMGERAAVRRLAGYAPRPAG